MQGSGIEKNQDSCLWKSIVLDKILKYLFMRYKVGFTFFATIILFTAFAQTINSAGTGGSYRFIRYTDNVIKIIYQPVNYTTNECVSNAVLVNPSIDKSNHPVTEFPVNGNSTISLKNISIKLENGAISINKNDVFKLDNVFNKNGFRGFSFRLSADEKIFGGGERALPLNRRGYKFDLYNNPWYGYSEGADNLNFSIPFFTSSKGYALFFDNASKGYADIGKTNNNVFDVGFVSGELNVYLIIGNDYKEILSSYFKLTGTQPLPPRWAMGNFMSRFGYSSEAHMKDVLSAMQSEHIPVDAVIFDLFWFGDSIKNTLGNLEWMNKSKWPAPKKMITDLTKQHINSILITEPFILKGTRTYNDAARYLATDSFGKPFSLTNFYFGEGGVLDIFRKDAGNWIWKSHYKRQIANGVAGWWTDLGEPEKHPTEMMHNLADIGYKRKFGADEVHNAYGHYWNRFLFSHYLKDYPDTRLFHLNRSGFAGSQRYSIFPWSGDVSRSWSGLKAQIPLMLGMSMSGIPYIHADAGGFAGGEGDNELYVRWLQFASFTPIFRPHGTALGDIDKNAFSFPSEPALIEQPFRDYAKDVVNRRYSMLPYNYTLAYRQAAKGQPLVAPLYYYYPNDTTTTNIQDEFMWGENILVAPILEKGISKRSVYLPAGKWYYFNEEQPIEGEIVTTASADINQIPFYIKEGSFIITNSNAAPTNTAGINNDELLVTYYYSKLPSNYNLYEDDGTSKNAIKNKQFQLISFKAPSINNKLIYNITTHGGNFKGKLSGRKLKFILHGLPATQADLYINGKYIEHLTNRDIPTGLYSFNVNYTNKPMTIEIK